MSKTQEKINADFMAAFKAGTEGRDKKNFLGLVKGEIQLASSKPDFNGEESVMKIVIAMEKSLKVGIDNGDPSATVEMEYLKPYLPQLMERSEITSIVTEIISTNSLSGAQDVGKVMGGFNKNHKGKADNNIVKEVALELL